MFLFFPRCFIVVDIVIEDIFEFVQFYFMLYKDLLVDSAILVDKS